VRQEGVVGTGKEGWGKERVWGGSCIVESWVHQIRTQASLRPHGFQRFLFKKNLRKFIYRSGKSTLSSPRNFLKKKHSIKKEKPP